MTGRPIGHPTNERHGGNMFARTSTLRYVLNGFALIAGFGFVPAGFAADKLYVQSPANYASGTDVNPKIKAECALESKVATHVIEQAGGNFEVVASPSLSDAGAAKALTLTITDVMGVGGGAWSGAKGITIKGTLKQGGKVIGTFEARRNSGGGAFGGYKGTCSILGRCAKALGKDVSDWLAQPSMNAKLGELK
jgi:hypothetical protein